MQADKSGRLGLRHFVLFTVAVALMIWWVNWNSASLHRGPLLPPGQRASLHTLRLLTGDGKPWRVADEGGRPFYLNIWATWCGPCRAEIPDLNKLASEGICIVGVNVDEEPEQVVPDFLRRTPLAYRTLFRPEEGFSVPGGIPGIPTTLLVDAEGRVAKRYVGMVSPGVLREDWRELH